MRIAIFALGSRGDVQPYVALGQGLQAAGHDVRLIASENFRRLVSSQTVEFWPIQGNVQEFAESPEMRALLEKGNFMAIMSYAESAARQAMLGWAKDGLAACRGQDLIISGIGGMYIGLALAEKLSIAFLQAHYVPFTPTGAFPGALIPPAVSRFGRLANLLSHHLTRQMMWQQIRRPDSVARHEVLQLPPVPFFGPYHDRRLQNTPVLYGISPAVIGKPADWGENIHLTGYWFLQPESAWTPPPALEEFLARGKPPIYIGFGSMSSRRPQETADLILKALAQTGQRAVMVSGWGGLLAEKLPETVLVIDSVPHDWLFERVAAVVHHGGAGTTAAGLRAGVPSIIIPFFADQPFWAQRVVDLGVGPQPIARKRLTIERLAQAIEQAVEDSAMRQRAAALGAKIRMEDGIGKAVQVIESTGLSSRTR